MDYVANAKAWHRQVVRLSHETRDCIERSVSLLEDTALTATESLWPDFEGSGPRRGKPDL